MYSCGNDVYFHYPFWKIEDSTAHQHCGYPGFGLRCSDSGEPMLGLPNNVSYYVKDLNFIASTITLVDVDVVHQACPRARHNISLGTLPLDYSPLDVNLSFYFNCTLDADHVVPPITCLGIYGIKKSYVFTEGEEPDGFDWSESCEENVVVTVKETEITSSIDELIGSFGVAMNNGFVLNWTVAKECDSCEVNGGLCGYKNLTVPEFLCFCRDGSIGTRNNGLCKKLGMFVDDALSLSNYKAMGLFED
ncbi:putative wall-associated receptor kinase [Rosa chinensis]|uniref:non-specific serine/threonine protein kinase n=2 Tax=Rosa chinensis TaxID=74649 RepID=A0A2P6P3T8_ROSCH|nr:LEAF RUST 10 DISEASE-RESISTANCE LOCUS RECEPTOR-LIKE PROTEIN KINASE-like 2.7 isoform X2 [Rosa chinensis]XP_040368023.1 LEAF RUST 10 DISEASE-RESISTANCE LOCUS RECEPTOR-LIKE PROTEIN KINASE-like 2.7 isoform X2 [Rosa chinensis]PRQ16593.1 putative wall-associated receptor kinase [Rosa chinensis]